MKMDDLKSKILQLAIQGKLVEQSSKDIPASVLIEQIELEKERLIKEKKFKKGKKIQEVNNEEKTFDIPIGWRWVRLGDLFNIVRGSSPRPKGHPKYFTEEKTEYNWVTIKDITQYSNNDKLSKTNEYLTYEGSLKSRFIENGEIIIAVSGSIGKTVIMDMDGYIYDGLAGLKNVINDTVFIKYIYFVLNTWKRNLNNISEGTSIQNINTEKLNLIPIALPPIQEQRRIICKVEELFSIIDELNANKEAMLKNISDSRNKVLQLAIQGKLVEQCEDDEPAELLLKKIAEEKELLIKEKKIKKEKLLPEITEEEKVFDIPNGWEWCRLGNIGDWGAGATPSRGNLSYYNGDICWIKTGELNDGFINGSEEKITEKALRECSLRLNKAGDVLIAMYGATIGKLGILNIEATTNQACCACTVFSQIYNKYLYVLLLAMRQEFRNQSFGGAQPNISKHKIINTVVALPPLEEQKRIVSKIDEIMSYLDELENTILERYIM